jgi:hypothetical protein
VNGSAPYATVVDGKLFYANVATDIDFLAAPLPTGVETFSQVRSAASPEQEEFKVDLPAGAKLEALPDSGGAAVVRDGKRIAHIAPPTGSDADGA